MRTTIIGTFSGLKPLGRALLHQEGAAMDLHVEHGLLRLAANPRGNTPCCRVDADLLMGDTQASAARLTAS